ncbi:hypothetical protein ACFYQA_39145 [Streptomyces sp. NPDC005774]|uniref:hypothetical protein n=1 Tax=Streptomyces sp. NPDC005774 TaxID=3364728 RepID=UPI0036AB4348
MGDWQTARALLTGAGELDELFTQVRMLRLLKATDLLAWVLVEAWGATSYADASSAIRRALGNESLVMSRQESMRVSLMSMHRSKGKEFGVVVEGTYSSKLLDAGWGAKRMGEARRLLRGAVTRAHHGVVFVRPVGALPARPATSGVSS